MLSFISSFFKKRSGKIGEKVGSRRPYFFEISGNAHAVVIGRSRAGKSELLKRIAYVVRMDFAATVIYTSSKSLSSMTLCSDRRIDFEEDRSEFEGLLDELLKQLKSREDDPSVVPIVVIVDEALDIVNSEKENRDVVQKIRRLLTKGAASRIFLWIATQSAKVENLAIPLHNTGYIYAMPGISSAFFAANGFREPPAIKLGQFFVLRSNTSDDEGRVVEFQMVKV
jgi:hypothetical protein